MRIARFIFVLCFALAIANCPPASAQGPAGSSPGLETPSGPLAEVPERLYDFGDLTDEGIRSQFRGQECRNCPPRDKKSDKALRDRHWSVRPHNTSRRRDKDSGEPQCGGL